MRIVIIGVGTIGRAILETLSGEGHAVTIIDENPDKVEALIEQYDVSGVVGNGACLDIQREAKVRHSDLVVAMTGSDEVNILASMVAKRAGAQSTIARVRNPDYSRQISMMREELGISMVVNPEKETAEEIFNLINLPSIAQVEHFAKGKVLLVQIVVAQSSRMVGETLISLNKKLTTKVLFCAVQRGEEVIIPTGQFVFAAGDRIHFTSDADSLRAFLTEIGMGGSPLRRVMIVGGGRTGYYLARELSSKKYKTKLIESDKTEAEELADSLPKVTVVQANGTSHALLREEGIESMDAFVALTGIDEENIIVSLFANNMGVKKAITRVKTDELLGMVDELGIENTVSPKHIVADRVFSYIRALANKRGSNILTLYRLVGGRVEALEFAVKKMAGFLGKPLKELTLKEDCLVACIIRGEEVIIPDGASHIEMGDGVIVVTTHKNFNDLSDIFA